MLETTGTREFTVSHEPTEASITVRINFDHTWKYGEETLTVMEAFKGVNEFWSDSESRLSDFDDDIVKCFLYLLCDKVMKLDPYGSRSVKGIIADMKNEEGFPPLDGSIGITLLNVDAPEYSTWEFEFQETEYVQKEEEE